MMLATEVDHTFSAFVFVQTFCKLLHVAVQYTQLSNCFWMLCEGIYLHTRAVLAVFREKQKMWLYVLLGWSK